MQVRLVSSNLKTVILFNEKKFNFKLENIFKIIKLFFNFLQILQFLQFLTSKIILWNQGTVDNLQE